jgi:hypothetical protein
MPKKQTPAAERQRETQHMVAAPPRGVRDNRPDTSSLGMYSEDGWLRKQADVRQVSR